MHGQLPFEVRGLGIGGNAREDDPIPNVELVFTPSPSSTDDETGDPKLTRADVESETSVLPMQLVLFTDERF